jgi:hypothetical protein
VETYFLSLLGTVHSLDPSEQRRIAFVVVSFSVFVFAPAHFPIMVPTALQNRPDSLEADRPIRLPSLPPLPPEFAGVLYSLRMLIETKDGGATVFWGKTISVWRSGQELRLPQSFWPSPLQ